MGFRVWGGRGRGLGRADESGAAPGALRPSQPNARCSTPAQRSTHKHTHTHTLSPHTHTHTHAHAAHQHAVVELLAALLVVKHAAHVQLERALVRLDGDRHGLLRHRLFQRHLGEEEGAQRRRRERRARHGALGSASVGSASPRAAHRTRPDARAPTTNRQATPTAAARHPPSPHLVHDGHVLVSVDGDHLAAGVAVGLAALPVLACGGARGAAQPRRVWALPNGARQWQTCRCATRAPSASRHGSSCPGPPSTAPSALETHTNTHNATRTHTQRTGVGVVLLELDAAVVLHELKGVVHEAPLAALVAVLVAVYEVLLRQRQQAARLQRVDALDGAGRGERPARAALAGRSVGGRGCIRARGAAVATDRAPLPFTIDARPL